jgi:S1-C subfamily serine protease
VIRPDIGIAKVMETEEGLLIATLVPGGAAEKAGLRGMSVRTRRSGMLVFKELDRSAADLILAVDGEETKNVDDFLSSIESHQAGDQVVVNVVREGRKVDIPVRLEHGE